MMSTPSAGEKAQKVKNLLSSYYAEGDQEQDGASQSTPRYLNELDSLLCASITNVIVILFPKLGIDFKICCSLQRL